MPLKRTPLDAWLAAKLGLAVGETPDAAALARFRLARLQETVAHARANSPFYSQRLAGLPEGFPQSLADFARAPLITADDLRQHHLAMTCVSQGRVARVVTLSTSGTTAAPKRLYFSQPDLELTLDFFHHGMRTLVEPGETVMILLPGSTPDSVGDLLSRALNRMQVRGVVHGPVTDTGQAVRRAIELAAGCLVGIPVQVLAMAEHPAGGALAGRVKSVLLTTDYVPRALTRRIQAAWGCEVFEHYGMTETGLGGGVDCAAHQGYHLRAADLYYEVVEPQSGRVLPVGREGELVVSTFTRQAMPLLRYRTGDWGRLLAGACACGGAAPRLARIPGRLANCLPLCGGATLPMWQLDEALFSLPGLLDWRAGLAGHGRGLRLDLQVQSGLGAGQDLAGRARRALKQIPQIAEAIARGQLALGEIKTTDLPWPLDGSAKRTLRAGY